MWNQIGGPPVAKPGATPFDSDTRLDFSDTKAGDYSDADGEDDDEEEPADDGEMIDFDQNTPITPNFIGFQEHVIRLYPMIERNYLVDRIAHQQVVRYKALLQWRVKHQGSIASQNCPAGHHCIALGGSSTLLEPKNQHRDSDASNAGAQGLADASDGDSNPEGALAAESFPPGVPMPPAQTLPAEFECQLCFRVKKFLKPSDWTKHVHEDVQPFTCTYANCKEPKSFKRKADWVRHENERHRRLSWWACTQDDCQHKCYRKDNFLQHLVREHKLPEPKQKSKAAAKKARNSDEPIWVLIRNCHHQTTTRPQEEPCKFCGKVFNSWKKLTVHLAKHMELISLSVLRLVEQQFVSADTIISPVGPLPALQAPLTLVERTDRHSSSDFVQDSNLSASISPHVHSISQFSSTHVIPQFPSPLNPQASITQFSGFMCNQNMGYNTTTTGQDMSSYNVQPPIPHYQPGSMADSNGIPYSHQMGPQMDSTQSRGFLAMDQAVPVVSLAGAVSSPILQPPLEAAKVSSSAHLSEKVPEQEFDLQSIASLDPFHDSALGSSNPSTGSLSSMQGVPQSAQEEVLLALHSNAKLRPLLAEAARKANNDRFTRNIRRALVQYGDDLRRSAADDGEKAVTVILKRHSQWIASNLYDLLKPDRDISNRRMNDLLKQAVDRRHMLERFLAEKSVHHGVPQENPTLLKIEEDDESLSVGSNDNTEEDLEFPKLDHLVAFLTGGQEFESLRKKISNFIRPEKPGITLREEDEYGSTAPADKPFGLATTSINMKPDMHPGIKEVSISTRQAVVAATENLPDIESIPAVAELLEVAESRSHNISSVGSDNSRRNNHASMRHNHDPSTADPASVDSQMQDYATIEGSYQASTSTEKTDVSLMNYEVDQSDDELGSPSIDGSEYADARTEERLSDPRSYFTKLEKLEREIYDTSSIWIYKHGLVDKEHFPSADDWCRVVPLDGHADDLQRSIETLNEKIQSDLLMRLLECYNIAQRSYHNMQKLQASSFCGGYISILVAKNDRPGIANLFRIWHVKVLELCENFESTLRIFESSGIHTNDRITQDPDMIKSFLTDNALSLTQMCMDLLTDIGLQPSSSATPLIIWQRTTQIIDFAVLSYVGAHIERFDKKFLGADVNYLRLPNPGPYFYDLFEEQAELPLLNFDHQNLGQVDHGATEDHIESNWPPVTLRRRRLRCLDYFLGGMDVWVFHQGHDAQGDERVFLSTDIETLTDVWGPLWKILRTSSHGRIERLDIGNGSIVPWASRLDSGPPKLQNGEVYCHWISSKTWNSEVVEEYQAGLERKYFLDTDRLLIGAKEHGLLVNRECKLTVACLRDIKSTLHDESALQRPGTDRPRRYADSYALQVQGSVLSAVSGAGMVTYKRRNGQNMKDTLVERWRHSKNPNPGELESFCGVEVSLCTQNARRRRLLELLNSTTMRKYLKGTNGYNLSMYGQN